MHISVITIFPAMFNAYMQEGILGRALERDLFRLDVHNLRDFTSDRHRSVDDAPYGGGPGMVMRPEPFAEAIRKIKSDGVPTLTIMPTPEGKPFNQAMAEELSLEPKRLLFLAGRYEGIDDRVRQTFVDREISLGDYILTGGELAVLVILDAVLRLVPGAVGDEDSLKEESFSWGILDYPHYTRPAEWENQKVPEALLTGNHKQIALWRRKEALRRTMRLRPELMLKAGLTKTDNKLIKEIQEEEEDVFDKRS